MKETLVSFTVAQLAKEKGFKFDETLDFYHEGYHGLFHWHTDKDKITCMSFFENDSTNTGWFYMNIEVPTQSLLQRWVWETHSIWVQSTPIFTANECIGVSVTISSWRFPVINVNYVGFDVYDGLENGLFEALKLI